MTPKLSQWILLKPFGLSLPRSLDLGCSLRFGFWVLLFLLFTLPALAQSQQLSPTEAMLAANQRYEAGDFAGAVAAYTAIEAAGIQDSTLYYNLGNAYFKQGDLGRAILYYRRSHVLAPRDTDTSANLAVARAQTVDQIEATAEGVLVNMVEVAEEWLTLGEAAILALALWLLISLLTLAAILLPRWRRLAWSGIAILGVFLVIGLISMANRYYMQTTYPPAVIVASEVNVTSGPGGTGQYLLEFTLHSGAEVRLLESRPGWERITLPGDLQGWVPAETVEPVIQ